MIIYVIVHDSDTAKCIPGYFDPVNKKLFLFISNQ
jgi:hypothetical protein